MLVGCSSGSGTAATELKEGDTVKIGLNYELSSAVASYGQAEYKGATLAIKENNTNKDSKYKIKAVKMDNKGDVSIPLSEVHAICYRSPHNPLKKSIFFKS